MSGSFEGPPQVEAPPTRNQAQVAPDWGFERDAGHVWSAIASLKEKAGELHSGVATCTGTLNDLRSDIKGLEGGLKGLETEQKSATKSLRLLGLAVTPILAAVAWFAPYYWSNGMRPELEKAIAGAVKADLEREANARERTRALEAENAALKTRLKSLEEK